MENGLTKSVGAVEITVLCPSLSHENGQTGASHLPWTELGAAGTKEGTEASFEKQGQ